MVKMDIYAYVLCRLRKNWPETLGSLRDQNYQIRYSVETISFAIRIGRKQFWKQTPDHSCQAGAYVTNAKIFFNY